MSLGAEITTALVAAHEYISRAVGLAQSGDIPKNEWLDVARTYQEIKRKMAEFELTVTGVIQ